MNIDERFEMEPFDPGTIQLLPGLLFERTGLNTRYLKQLQLDNLLRNFYFEAACGVPLPVQKTYTEAGNTPLLKFGDIFRDIGSLL